MRDSDVWLWDLMCTTCIWFWGLFYVYAWWTGGEYR